MKKLQKINWVNTLFLIINPIVATIGTAAIIWAGAFSWKTVVLGIVLLYAGGFGITAGYHRLFSHCTYKASWPVRFFLMLFGSGTFEGSVLEWCTDHRNHHRYTDTDKDPYSINKGFWFAHMGWLFTLDTDKRDFSNVEDLMQDPMLRFQHRFFIPVAIFVGYLLPIAIASLWGDFWGGLFIAGALRIALMQQFTFCINSICHMFGKRNFSDKSSARDNWVTALLTFGEGYHNFHHKFPLDYRNGIRFYHFDPAKWLISSLEVVGLVSDVKRVKEHRIIKSRLSMDQKKLETIKNKYGELADNVNKAMQPVYESVQQVLNRMEELETVYKELKASRVELMRGRANEYKKRAREYRQQINESKKELKRLMKEWTNLMDNYPLAT